MSLYTMPGNGEFQLNNWLDLCPEIIPAGNESERRNVWLACQISENQDKNDISNQIGDSIDGMLRIDHNNLVKYGQQIAISVTDRLAKSFHILHIIKSCLK